MPIAGIVAARPRGVGAGDGALNAAAGDPTDLAAERDVVPSDRPDDPSPRPPDGGDARDRPADPGPANAGETVEGSPTATPAEVTLAAALAHVESLPLGQAVIVHNRESGAMVETNAFGAMLVDHLRARPDPAAVVETMAAALELPAPELQGAVADTLARWEADGMFLTAQRPFPRPVPYRPVAGGALRRFVLGSRAVTVSSEDTELIEDIDRALAPMQIAMEGARGDHVPALEVVQDGPGYGVFRDGAPVWGVAGYELTRFHLLREIMDILCGPDRIAAQLHASAMALDGRALVFAGASGSGKSTLAALLAGAGAVQVADDHVALSARGDSLLGFPTRPNLKPGGLAAVARGDALQARVAPGEEVPLAGLVFPRYGADADNALTRFDPEAALRELIQTGSRVSRRTRSIAPLLRALKTRPSWRLSYSDSDFAVETCRKLFAG